MIVLNGGSSSGKTGIVRCLQAILPDAWLAFGVDSFVDAMPAAMQASDDGIDFGPNGEVVVGPEFRRMEAAWMAGLRAMCLAGARIIVDDVFLGGRTSRLRWEEATTGLEVLWVGVYCDAEVAAGRELARGDRTPGMAASQAAIVHTDVHYDVTVDTAHTESIVCARTIAEHLK